MTRRILRPCAQPGCPVLTTSTLCVEHTRKAEHARQQQRGPRAYDRRAWKRIRIKKLADQPMCELKLVEDCRVFANEVHHRDGDEWNMADDNLQSACKPCHSAVGAAQAFGRSA